MKLYEISEAMQTLQQMMEDEPDNQVIKDTLEAIEGEAEYKLEQMAMIIKNLNADVEAYNSEIARMTARKNTIKNNIDWLKFEMLGFMNAHNIQKVKGEVLNVSVAKNGGKLPIILDVDVESLPDELVKIEKSADNSKIAEMLDNGDCLFAHYGERGSHINIR